MAAALRNPFLHTLLNLSAVGGATYYLRQGQVFNYEESEARMDEIEGTLRGHIGLIYESLERIEGKKGGGEYGSKMNELYEKRHKDDKK